MLCIRAAIRRRWLRSAMGFWMKRIFTSLPYFCVWAFPFAFGLGMGLYPLFAGPAPAVKVSVPLNLPEQKEQVRLLKPRQFSTGAPLGNGAIECPSTRRGAAVRTEALAAPKLAGRRNGAAAGTREPLNALPAQRHPGC